MIETTTDHQPLPSPRALAIHAGVAVLLLAFSLFFFVANDRQTLLSKVRGQGGFWSKYVTKADSGHWHVIDLDDKSADEFLKIHRDPTLAVATARFSHTYVGFPITYTRRRPVIFVDLVDNTLISDPVRSEILEFIFNNPREFPFPQDWDRRQALISGTSFYQIEPRATIYNIMFVITFPLALWMGWRSIRLGTRWSRHRQEASLLAASLCPRCQYDLSAHFAAGLSTCPECGLSVTPPPRSASAVPASAHPPPPPSPSGPQV